MSHLKNKLIKFDPKTGQAVSVQGGANASQTAAMQHSHKSNTLHETKLNTLNRALKGGAVRGQSGAYGPGLGSGHTQQLLIKSNALHAGQKASPKQLAAARSNPGSGSGLDAPKTTVIMKGGRHKKTQKKRKRKRRTKKHTKRFRRGGQTQKPWGCFSGGRTRSGKKRRKSKRKN